MSVTQRACLSARRAKLSALTDGAACVVAAGRPQSRNFPANVYPFRASSHFLYLVGASLDGAVFVQVDGESTLYVHRDTPSDVLWHGPSVPLVSLEEQTACAVRYLDELDLNSIKGAMTLPVMDQATNSLLAAWVGREVSPNMISSVDEPLAQAMVSLRMVHDVWAIEELERAAAVTVLAHEAARETIEPGIYAHHVWAAMQSVMTQNGMGWAYNPIVTPYGEVLHSHRLDYPLSKGDLLLIDVGAETETGWAGDVTRTWPVSGEYSSSQKAMYEVVLAAHAAAIEMVRPGVHYRDVHLAACRVLTEGLVALGVFRGDVEQLVADDAHALFFPHGIGHLLGLDVHDMEDLGDRPGYAPGMSRSARFGLSHLRLDRPLEAGMVVTIEPGFYQVPSLINDPDWRARLGDRIDWRCLDMFSDVRGIRIEDDVLVTEGSPRVLTAALST